MARSKAYLFKGVELRWSCDESIPLPEGVPAKDVLHFPGGLADYLATTLVDRTTLTATPFVGEVELADSARVEWAIAWPEDGDGFASYYCNTISTPDAGTHEAGLRTALTRSLRAYGELVGNRRASIVAAEDIVGGAGIMLSLFMREPQFQGQTKDRLVSPEAQRLVETAVKDRFDHWLSDDPVSAKALLENLVEKAEDRQRRRSRRSCSARPRPASCVCRASWRIAHATAPLAPRSFWSRVTRPAVRPSRRATVRLRQFCLYAARS